MSKTVQRVCAWGGVTMTALWVGGFWVFCGFVPPPSPTAGPAEIAGILYAHTTEVRLGLLLCMVGAAFLAPYSALISVQMRRIEGHRPTLAYAQLVLATCLILEFIIPVMFFEGALIRPRDPGMLQVLDDILWVMFVGTVSTAVLQLILIGVAMLGDRRPEPIFPRWLGYLNLWIGVLFCGGGLCVFFRTGPFAWNGIFAFWIPLGVFGIWMAAMTAQLLRAINRDDGAGPDHERIERLSAQVAELTARLDDSHPAVHS